MTAAVAFTFSSKSIHQAVYRSGVHKWKWLSKIQTMKQQFLNSQHSATFASPATPSNGGQIPKGWSSERVAVSKYSSRNRHVHSSAALFPFSSGRALPSKWDDAERWICSPVFGQEGSYSSKSLQLIQSERRAKSKSGPLGPQMLGNYSPLIPVAYGAPDSPFLGHSNNSSYGGRRSCPGQSQQELACTREWLKMLNEPPEPDSPQPQEGDSKQDDDGEIEEGENQVTRALSRRDMGTQMLPSEGSSNCSSPPPAAGNDSPEMDETVKDVKVDKEDTFPIRRRAMDQNRQSRPNRSPPPNDSDDDDSRLPVPSKLEREEAKIDEWENRQRAKAEAAIRKLEMKLERKRSQGMEKIMKKLKRAELKAEKMRASVAEIENENNISNPSRNQIGRRTTQWMGRRLYRRIRMGCFANCVAWGCG